MSRRKPELTVDMHIRKTGERFYMESLGRACFDSKITKAEGIAVAVKALKFYARFSLSVAARDALRACGIETDKEKHDD